jgi:hypothetical protein
MRKLLILFSLAALACSSKPDPKDVVFDFIDAVLTSDSLRVAKDLDVDAYLKNFMTEMTPEDSAAALEANRGKTIRSLLDDGEVRSRWLRQQIVVNEAFVADTTAEVEVSFIDKSSGHMVYSRMQLSWRPDEDTWKIVFFR